MCMECKEKIENNKIIHNKDKWKLSGKIKVCKCCGEEKPIEEFWIRHKECKICNYLNTHLDLKIKENWNLNEYKIILDYLLNEKVSCINEILIYLKNKSLENLINLLKTDLKIKIGQVKIKIKIKCSYCDEETYIILSRYNRNKKLYCSMECKVEASKYKKIYDKNNKEIKKCNICKKTKELNEFISQRNICKVCNYIENHKKIIIKEGWIIDDYRIILDNILNYKVKYVDELVIILKKSKTEIAEVLKDLKLNGAYSVRIKTKCEYCQNELELTLFKYFRSDIHFCKNECKNKWQSDNIKGESHPNYNRIKMNCDWCGGEIYKSPSKIDKSEFHFCNRDCSEKWFKNIFVKTDRFINRNREIALKNLADGVYKTDSTPQNIINELLKKLSINNINEKIVGFYSFDNYLTEQDLYIEINGSYWHCDPRLYSKINYSSQRNQIFKDKTKNSFLKNQYNKNVLYLWEEDINNDILLCEKLMLKFIENRGILENYNSFNYYLDINKKLNLKKRIIKSYIYYNIEELDLITDLNVKYKPSYYIHFNCDQCGEEVIRLKSKYTGHINHFCSNKCKHEFHNIKCEEERINIICEYCKKEITKIKSQHSKNEHHFCSKECYDKWQKKLQVDVICEECGKEFVIPEYKYKNNKTKKFYCCKGCYENNRKAERITFECETCGKEKTIKLNQYNKSKHHFCSQKCSKKHNELYRKGNKG